MTAVEQVVDGYVALVGMDGTGKWKWAKKLSDLLDTEADAKTRTQVSNAIGIAIAEKLGRSKPYSGSWVRNYAAAYKKFPVEPTTPAECADFLAAVNGNAPAATSKTSMTNEDRLKMLASLAKSAVKHGCTVEEVQACIQLALDL